MASSPTPWAVGFGGGTGATTFVYELDADGRQHSAIASCFLEHVDRSYEERAANAALIVTAVNERPTLLATNAELVKALGSIKWKSADRDNMEFTALITYSQMDAIRNALATVQP